jgi:hypothetical protein
MMEFRKYTCGENLKGIVSRDGYIRRSGQIGRLFDLFDEKLIGCNRL